MILKQYDIPGEPRSKKNSQQLVQCKGRTIPIPSKAYKEFEARAGANMKDRPEVPIDTPVTVTCIFMMRRNKDGSEPKRQSDLCNFIEAVTDVLVKHKILADDDSKIVKSHDGSRIYYTSEDPHTIITISEYEDEDQ